MQGSGRVYEAPPETTPALEDAFFYHSMDLPESGFVDGLVDLRPYVDEYLGNVDFAGRRVLEIGPASGYLTFHMEGQGAEVVALEIADGLVHAIRSVINPDKLQHLGRVSEAALHPPSH